MARYRRRESRAASAVRGWRRSAADDPHSPLAAPRSSRRCKPLAFRRRTPMPSLPRLDRSRGTPAARRSSFVRSRKAPQTSIRVWRRPANGMWRPGMHSSLRLAAWSQSPQGLALGLWPRRREISRAGLYCLGRPGQGGSYQRLEPACAVTAPNRAQRRAICARRRR